MRFLAPSVSAVALVFALGACGSPKASAPDQAASDQAVPVEASTADAPPPPLDVDNARQFVNGASQLVEVDVPASGAASLEGEVNGEDAPVYAVAVGAGQTLGVSIETTNPNLYFNVSEATDHSGAAVHRGEVDGTSASLKAERGQTYVITLFQPRATARRGEAGRFTLVITRQ